MAFESLTDKLQNIFKNLRSKGRLTEADVKEAMKEVKRALLEADVNFRVVKSFIKTVTDRAIGQADGHQDCERRDGVSHGIGDDGAGHPSGQ